MNDFPVGKRLGGFRRRDGEQEVFQVLVGEGGREGPGNAGLFGSTENEPDGVSGNAETFGNGAFAQMAFEFQAENISDLTHGTPRVWHTTSSVEKRRVV